MDHGVLNTATQREVNSFLHRINPAHVERSKVFLSDWWADIGSRI